MGHDTKTSAIWKPFWKQKTFWSATIAVILSLPDIEPQLRVLVPASWQPKMHAGMVIAFALMGIFARQGSSDVGKEAVAVAGSFAKNDGVEA